MADWEVANVTPSTGWEVVSQERATPKAAKATPKAPDWMFPFGAPEAAKEGMGAFLQDAADTPRAMWEGGKALVGRVAHDVVNPDDAWSDIKAIGKGVGHAVMNPGETIDNVIFKSSAEHPAQAVLNALTMGSGGGVTAGRAAAKTASRTAGRGAAWVEKYPNSVLSGLSRDELKLASEAGVQGGAEGEAFKNSMRGHAEKEAIVGQAQDAADAWAAQNGANYLADKSLWSESNKMLDGGAVYDALADARKAHSFGGVADNGSVLNALNIAQEIIDRRLKRPVPGNMPDVVPPRAVPRAGAAGDAHVSGPAGAVHTPTPPHTPVRPPLVAGAETPSVFSGGTVTIPAAPGRAVYGQHVPGRGLNALPNPVEAEAAARAVREGVPVGNRKVPPVTANPTRLGAINTPDAVYPAHGPLRVTGKSSSLEGALSSWFDQPEPHAPRMTGATPGVSTTIPAVEPSVGAVFDRLHAAQNQAPHAPRMSGPPPATGTVAPGVSGPLPSKHYTPAGFDKLKQELDTLMYDRNVAPEGTKARAAVGKVADAVRSTLYENAPGYKDAMGRAGEAIAALKEVRSTLSLGEKAKIDTAMSKLQSALRNDVSSRYGYRKTLLDKLSEFDSTLPFSVAGGSFNSVAPKGIAKPLAGHAIMTGALSAAVHPGFLAALTASIPRLQGEARYAAGAALRKARGAGITQKNIGLLGDAARVAGTYNEE